MAIPSIIAILLIPKPLLMTNTMQLGRFTLSNIERSVPPRLSSFTGFLMENDKKLYARINRDGGVNVFVWFLTTNKTWPSLPFLRACLLIIMTLHFLISCNLALGIALLLARSPC